MAFADLYAAVSGIGDAYQKGLLQHRRQTLGQMLTGANPDYGAAAAEAFGAGDVSTGVNLLSLVQKGRQLEVERETGAAFSRDVGNLFGGGGGGLGDIGAAPRSNALPVPTVGSSGGLGSLSSLPAFTRAAQQYGLDPSYLPVTASIESNGDPNAKNPKSSAAGILQFTSGTARDMGLSNPYDVEAAADAGARLAVRNAKILRAALGQDPTPAQLYLAHQQGPRGAALLLRNPDKPAIEVLTTVYNGNRAKAAQALRNNRGSLDMTAGDFANLWLSKFDQRARGLNRADLPALGAREAGFDPMGNFDGMETAPGGFVIPPGPSAAPDAVSDAGAAPGGLGVDPGTDLRALFSQALLGPGGGFTRPDQIPPVELQNPNAVRRTAPPAGSYSARVGPVQAPEQGAPLPPARPGGIGVPGSAIVAAQAEPRINNGITDDLDSAGDFARAGMGMGGAALPADVPVAYASGQGLPAPASRLVPGSDPRAAVPLGGMTLPADAQGPAPVSSATVAQAVANAPPELRDAGLGKLLGYVANPNLPAGAKEIAKVLLQQKLSESKMPDAAREFLWARANGQTRAKNLTEYRRELKEAERGDDAGDKLRKEFAAREEAALQLGLTPGTAEYNRFVAEGKISNGEPSAQDRKAIFAAEDQLPALDSTIDTLQRARELNRQTYTGATAGARGWAGSSLPDWMVPDAIAAPGQAAATREFGQIMSLEALKSMSQTLKGATTEREMAKFMEILGDPTTPPDIRERTIGRMLGLAQRQRGLAVDRIQSLRGGDYFRPGRGAAGTTGQARAEQPRAPRQPISIPSRAVQALQANPQLATEFDAKYGPGASAQYLGGR